MEVYSISHLFPLELSLTHDHVVANNVDCSDLDVDIVQVNDDDDLEIDNEIDEYSNNVDFAFNQQDIIDPKNPSITNVDKEHSVSQGVISCESEDIISNDSQIIDTIDPGSSRVIEVQLHPSGRPVRQVTGRGKPLDDQFLYEN